MIHHKHHDLLWKAIFMMVHITYWFHPGMKDLIRQLDQWGEAYCDRTASYYIESMKTYFNVIIDITTDATESSNISPLAQVGIGLNQIMLSFFGQQSSLNIVHPIAIYYE